MENLTDISNNAALIWFIAGLAFFLLEFILPGLIVLFFGIGCWSSTLILLVFPQTSLNTQVMVFLITAVLSLVLLRKSLKKRFESRGKSDIENLEEFIGKSCIARSDFSKGITGKVEFNGSLWDANSNYDISTGDYLVIKGVKSIHLMVEPA